MKSDLGYGVVSVRTEVPDPWGEWQPTRPMVVAV